MNAWGDWWNPATWLAPQGTVPADEYTVSVQRAQAAQSMALAQRAQQQAVIAAAEDAIRRPQAVEGAPSGLPAIVDGGMPGWERLAPEAPAAPPKPWILPVALAGGVLALLLGIAVVTRRR